MHPLEKKEKPRKEKAKSKKAPKHLLLVASRHSSSIHIRRALYVQFILARR